MSSGANKIEITQSTLLKLLVRRGSNEERKNIVLSEGELGYAVDTKKLFVGDGATVGGVPVTTQVFYGATSPIAYNAATTGDFAYDSTEGALYVLTGDDPTIIGDWGIVANDVRVDDATMQLITYNGVPNTLAVKTVSAAQLDPNLPGTGLEYSGVPIRTIQTTADQAFDSISLRSAAALQIPTTLQFGTAGGATQYSMPPFDGPNGYSLVTNGNGVLEWKPGNSVTEYLVLTGNQIPVGTILQFGSGGNFQRAVSSYDVPYGYFLCDGRTLSGTQYQALCEAIGTFYGTASAGTFKIPSLTASNYVYLIKYLEDQYIEPVTISLENSLTGLNVTASTSVSSFEIPQSSAVEIRLGVPDYVSKTYVDSIFSSLVVQNTVYKLAKMSEPNCSNGINALGFTAFIDKRTKALRFSGLDRSGTAGISNMQSNCTPILIDSPIEYGDAYECAEEIYGAEATTFVVTNSGNVYAAGDNNYGINGTNNSATGGINAANSRYTKLTFPAGAGKVTKISIGGAWWYSETYSVRHAFALTESGSAFAWGYNGYGQTGINSSTNQVTSPTSTHTGSLSDKLVSKIYSFCGNTYGYSFAIDTSGGVHACGYGGSYNFGNNSTANIDTGWRSLNRTADEIYAAVGSPYHTTYLLSGGRLWGCGYNYGYQIGRATGETYITTFVPVSSSSTSFTQLTGVSALSISDNYGGSCTIIALMQDQTIRTWGYNNGGQCGTVTTSEYITAPASNISTGGGFANAGIVKIKAHGYYPYSSVFVMNSAGQIWSTGYNGYGQLGNANTGSNSSFFTRVKQPRGVTYKDFNIYAEYNAIEYYTVLAVDANDNLYAWGGNLYSQCGFANYPTYGANNLTYYGTPLKINFN
jgi:alpha-tubulin suppressor-like RCC1 family protein